MPYFHTPFIRVGTVIQQEIATDTVLFQGNSLQLAVGGCILANNTGFLTTGGVISTTTSLGLRLSGFMAWTGAGTKSTMQLDGGGLDIEVDLVARTTGLRRLNVVSGTLQTGAGATGTVAATAALTDNAVTTVEARVTGGKSDESEGASYLLAGAYRRAGAGPIVVTGAPVAIWTFETDATANATLVIVGNTIEVQVTSPAGDTYDWTASVDLQART